MTLEAVLAALHLVAILTFVVFLSSQAALCRIEWLNAAVVERLVRLDVIYGVAGVVMIGSGLVRVFWGVKGASWYLSQPLFHLKITLVLAMSCCLLCHRSHFAAGASVCAPRAPCRTPRRFPRCAAS